MTLTLFSVLSTVFLSVSALFALTRQYQMLQQNSYFPTRYFKWLKGSYFTMLILEILLCAFFAFLYYLSPFSAVIFAAAMVVYRIVFAFRVQKKSIKKLVFTARVKRLYTAAAVVFAAIILLTVLSAPYRIFFFSVCLIFAFFPPLTALLCRGIMTPVETLINKWYVRDAKRILRERPDLIIIGITGSYGKTSTKFILSRLLSEKFNVVATPGSYNTTMGVVRTVREKLLPQTQVFICEMGAKNVGDIKEICDIVHPKYALITSVGPQHLDTFKSVDRVFQTKFELAKEVRKNHGKVFVNGDSEALLERIHRSHYTVYGTDPSFDVNARSIRSGPHGCEFTLQTDDTTLSLHTRLLSKHNIINIAGAAALALSLGVGEKELSYAVASLKPTEHRLEMKPFLGGSIMIDDAYNANPEGSKEAVRVLSTFEGMKKVIITPGLIELGKAEYDANFRLGAAAGEVCDYIILVGKNRSKPLAEGVRSTAFPEDNLFIVSSFAEATKICAGFADDRTAVLVENDLPDNYLY